MPPFAPNKVDIEIADELGKLAYDPLGFAKFAYPWNSTELEASGPRAWQSDILETIGAHLRNSKRFEPLRIAVSSGHGIGKSALISMISGWAMSCYEDARINVTANTGKQLDTKTWPEISIWFRRLINAHWFKVKGESITSKEAGHEETWRIDAVPWSENNPAAFAGLHNKGKIVVLIMDESSEIADIVWETSEGATTDEDTIIIWLAFGNPTQNTGRFRECFGKFKARWVRKQIDSRIVEGTNKKQLDEWVEDYGEDSDFVRVRVRGEFPRAGSSQFIAGDVVAGARERICAPTGWPVLSVDVARFGSDSTVIGLRRGLKFEIIHKVRGQDTFQTAQVVMREMERLKPRLTVIDADGLGAGVVDAIRNLIPDWFKRNPNCKLHEFHGGQAASDDREYYNLRAEMWGTMRDWLKSGDIPNEPELGDALTGPQYGFSNKNQIQLERKDDMKKRGLSSPDEGDCLAMSFATMPHRITREEIVAQELAEAKDPMQNYLIQLREHSRVEAQNTKRNWWD